MKSLKHPGYCKICGRYNDLTAEHIPPKNAFNSASVIKLHYSEAIKVFSGADGRLPWDVEGLHGTVQQGGHKRFCLCKSCNNNTGQWYMRSYTDFTKTVHAMIVSEKLNTGFAYSFKIKDLYPLRLYKAMLTMICDLNDNCLGDEKIRRFLMNKDNKEVDTSKYNLYMYLVSSQLPRMCGLSAVYNVNCHNAPVLVSEVAQYPIGFALYINKPETYNPFGLNADCFALSGYNETCDISFNGMPYLDINSPFPTDYRSKNDIIKCIKDTEKGKI